MSLLNYKLKNNKKAFTLIELIIVMAIVGILVLLAVPKFVGYIEKANTTKIISNIETLISKIKHLIIK